MLILSFKINVLKKHLLHIALRCPKISDLMDKFRRKTCAGEIIYRFQTGFNVDTVEIS